MKKLLFTLAIGSCLWTASGLVACSGNDELGSGEAEIEECEPADACSCEAGVERETRCTCVGGSTCEIAGDSIEFQCEGNADCGMTCGDDCLLTCPGTTRCDVVTGSEAVIECPGTASCYVTCSGSCELNIAGAARGLLTCEDAEADCSFNGCEPTDCGEGVFACRVDCPDD